jgi:peptidoglycan/LPS O-acetylase OafA/YrhL
MGRFILRNLNKNSKNIEFNSNRIKFRKDIQGLRAIAVLGVILCHLEFSYFSGGFIGVDIFFVISGFLVSQILVNLFEGEIPRKFHDYRIILFKFYQRRFWRIIPAAVATLFLVSIVSSQLFNPISHSRFLSDAIWSLFFVANYNFINQEVDYFKSGTLTSPIQHYWSLSVEEQFYLFFPAFACLVWFFAKWSKGNNKPAFRKYFLLGVVLFSLFSFSYSMYFTGSDFEKAYFSTTTRIWEFGLGAIASLLLQKRHKFSTRLNPLLVPIVLLAILLPIFVYTPDTKVPGIPALLPVLGTAIILWIGHTYTKHPLSFILENRVLMHVGNVSFSLYLVHWPIVQFVKYHDPYFLTTFQNKVVVLMGTYLTGILLFRLIENPLRLFKDSGFKAKSFYFTHIQRRVIVALLVLLMIGQFAIDQRTLKLGVQTPIEYVSSPLDPLSGRADSFQEPIQKSYQEIVNLWSRELKSSLDLKFLPPDLMPGLSEISEDKFLIPLNYGDFQNVGPKVAYVYGDSTALYMVPLLARLLESKNWRIEIRSFPGCGIFGGGYGYQNFDCEQEREKFHQEIERSRPDLILFTGTSHDLEWDPNISSEKNSNHLQLRNEINYLAQNSTKLIVLGALPRPSRSISDCTDSKLEISKECFSDSKQLNKFLKVQRFITESSGGIFVDATNWFCEKNSCPPIIGNTLIYKDGGHLTNIMANKLGVIFASYIKSLYPKFESN